jgi:hypothetical protein
MTRKLRRNRRYLVQMVSILFAGVIGALVGVFGVATGAWLQGRERHRRWIRDEKLRAAIEFISTTSLIYEHRRAGSGDPDGALWLRTDQSRAVLHLLCGERTVGLAERLIDGIRTFVPKADGSNDDDVISMLHDLVQQLRAELGATREGSSYISVMGADAIPQSSTST